MGVQKYFLFPAQDTLATPLQAAKTNRGNK